MFDDEIIKKLDAAFERVFSLPITRSTFRELQNAAVNILAGDVKKLKTLFECILTGSRLEGLKELIDKYSIKTTVAKDVFERGEFINHVTSDMLTQKERVVFLHRFRRVDGKELEFITDIGSNLRMVAHFASRLQEAKQSETGKKNIDSIRKELDSIKKMLDQV